MNKTTVILPVLALAVILSLVLLIPAKSNPRENLPPMTSLQLPTPSLTSQTGKEESGTPQVPTYPGVQSVQVLTETNPLRYTYSYTASDDPDKILAYYSAQLSEQGWIQLTRDRYPTFEWRDKSGASAFGLSLEVWVTSLGYNENNVTLYLSRWPEVDRIPVYPGAKEVVRKDVSNHNGIVEKAVTFTAIVSASELETYYRVILLDQGWKFYGEESRPLTTYPGLVFRSLYRSVTMLSIHGTVSSQGQLQVKLTYMESTLSTSP